MSIQMNGPIPLDMQLESWFSGVKWRSFDVTPGLALTNHAWVRMSARSLSKQAMEMVMEWGRHQYAGRGCTRSRIDRRVVRRAASLDVDLAPYEGVVVISDHLGMVISVWRNRTGERWRRKPATWKKRRRCRRWGSRRG